MSTNPPPKTPSNDVVWRVPEILKPNDGFIVTADSPGVVGVRDQLFIVWVPKDAVDPGTGTDPRVLMYSMGTRDEASEINSPDIMKWSEAKPVRTFVVDGTKPLAEGQTDKVSVDHTSISAPAVTVLGEVVHMVSVNAEKKMEHLWYMFDSNTSSWGFNVGQSAPNPGFQPAALSLAAFDSHLWCVFRDTQTNPKWHYSRWAPGGAWSEPVEIQGVPMTLGSPSLVELKAKLQVMLTWGDASTRNLGSYAMSSSDPQSWGGVSQIKLDPKLDPNPPGFSSVCFRDESLAVFAAGGDVLTCRYSNGMWQTPQRLQQATQFIKAVTAPRVAMLLTQLFCFFTGEDGRLYWSSGNVPTIPKLSNWMSRVKDDAQTAKLTIPGSHDSAAYRTRLFWTMGAARMSFPFAETQSLSIKKQLDSGIRYFDVRCGFPSSLIGPILNKVPFVGSRSLDLTQGLYAVHGTYVELYKGTDDALSIENLFQIFYKWIEHNKAQCRTSGAKFEGIFIQIKQDNGNDYEEAVKVFLDQIYTLITGERSKDYWLTGDTLPTMADIRGKIQLVRRFPKPTHSGFDPQSPFGIDVSEGWPNNSAGPLKRPVGTVGPHIVIQDVWDWSGFWATDIPTLKWQEVMRYLNAAKSDNPEDIILYLNFTSANAPLSFTSPHNIAVGWGPDEGSGINKRLSTYMNRPDNRTGGYGVLLMDFSSFPMELLPALVQSNETQFAP